MNKTLGGAKVPSRKADYLEFRSGDDTFCGNTIPLGSLSATQSSLGVTYPNIQGALDDLTATFLPINSIIINTDGSSPQGASQVDLLEISGTLDITEDQIILIYGIPVQVSPDETVEQITDKFIEIAKKYAEDSKLFSFVQKNPQSQAVDIKYIDFRPHPPEESVQFGLTITSTLQSPAKSGYGTWAKIGTEEKTLTGQSDPVLLHYIKRIA